MRRDGAGQRWESIEPDSIRKHDHDQLRTGTAPLSGSGAWSHASLRQRTGMSGVLKTDPCLHAVLLLCGVEERSTEYAAKVMMLTKDADSQRPEVMELKSKRTAAAAAR